VKPRHVAIIMDGNGRWATRCGLPRASGHAQGMRALQRIVQATPALGIGTLTLYAFSADNWRRPKSEVSALMCLFDQYLTRATIRCQEEGIRLSLIGRRDRIPPRLRTRAEEAERATVDGKTLHLRLAIDYSAREAIWLAVDRLQREARLSREEFAWAVRSGCGVPSFVPDVDLLIRTGGEQRLSDFLLWECAYAELWFTETMWPEFSAEEFAKAVADFERRDRRFGAIPAAKPFTANRRTANGSRRFGASPA
jgi:undecaprenyl diphosphate synthase